MEDLDREHGLSTDVSPARKLVPIKIGAATVYIEASFSTPAIESSDAIYAVAMPGPENAFETAMDAIKECIRSVGSHIGQIHDELHPDELAVEFSVQLEATGKGRIIPVLFTTEAKASAGLKVEAKWTLARK